MLKVKLFTLLFIGVLGSNSAYCQKVTPSFFTPADTLNHKRHVFVLTSETSLLGATLIGLNQIWYKKYPHANFHFINDNSEWCQMDKVGHFYTTYQLTKVSANALNWAGLSKKKQLLYGASISLAFMTTIEVFDGYSAEWGASTGDLIANASGTTLYVTQELLWKEQRILPKFSFHTTSYASQRPTLLGSTLNEQLIKDYNGQTYWLSFNLHSFFKKSQIPVWANLAIGYGAEGMLYGNPDNWANSTQRYRQLYLSFDVDLNKIDTKSHFLKTLFAVLNTIKIPAPTLEVTPNSGFKFHRLYF